jgi:hypothetical protein
MSLRRQKGRVDSRQRLAIAACVTAGLLLVPAMASAHIERASYWPDPHPDTSITPAAGGAVPTARSLSSALAKGSIGTTRVVCQPDSMTRLRASVNAAVKNGYVVRPSEPRATLTKKQGQDLIALNQKLFGVCAFDSIQAAVNASGNNDRVVVMPGIYTEPASRAAPTNDPKCENLKETNDRGQTGALSYAYQATCPNDQNLIALIGRQPMPELVPAEPEWDRHGIPDNGPCIRCNMQLEGSGVGADDVVVDAGRVASGNGAPPNPVKDIALRVDRGDGFVLRNMTFRHAREHGVYVVETDGYLLERFKAFHNEEYGLLTFTADHALIQDCEGVGAGDAGLYPGSSADTGEEVNNAEPPDFYAPEGAHFSTELRRCDMHHNVLGYSGTASNAVYVHNNDFYDNALGMVTDVITASGHPGFPQDSDLIENNEFYSNNFNPYVEQPPDTEVVPTLPIPVGTAMWILGGNNNEFRNNDIWDNWRRGIMLSTVQDSLVCGEAAAASGGAPNHQKGCNEMAPPEPASTSYRNEFHDNLFGRSPDGTILPNGNGNVAQGRTDIWWDQWAGSNTNCWYDNAGRDGTSASITSTPPAPLLPSSCDPMQSTGTGGAFGQDAEVYHCFVLWAGTGEFNGETCDWFTTPEKPEP